MTSDHIGPTTAKEAPTQDALASFSAHVFGPKVHLHEMPQTYQGNGLGPIQAIQQLQLHPPLLPAEASPARSPGVADNRTGARPEPVIAADPNGSPPIGFTSKAAAFLGDAAVAAARRSGAYEAAQDTGSIANVSWITAEGMYDRAADEIVNHPARLATVVAAASAITVAALAAPAAVASGLRLAGTREAAVALASVGTLVGTDAVGLIYLAGETQYGLANMSRGIASSQPDFAIVNNPGDYSAAQVAGAKEDIQTNLSGPALDLALVLGSGAAISRLRGPVRMWAGSKIKPIVVKRAAPEEPDMEKILAHLKRVLDEPKAQ